MVRKLALTACMCGAAVIGGCAVPVAMAATAGLGAAQAGTAAWASGELRTAKFADLETALHAVRAAMHDVHAEIVTERIGERSAFVMAKEPGGPEIRITLTRRTSQLTRIGIRVGMVGDLPTSRAVLLRIRAHLPARAIGLFEDDPALHE